MADETRTRASSPELLAAALSRAERQLTDRLSGVFALEGCTVEQARALALLADGAGHPMSELAAHVGLSPPTLTRVVDRMVADNFVHRKVDPRDRRRVLVYLAPRGRRLRRQLDRRLEECEQEILADARDGHAAELIRLLTPAGG